MFDKVLIANRGEIALRIHRTCREMGISTVAVHSTADADAMHVRLADESVCIGPPPARDSYLNIPAIIAAAEITGADAIHPGYGFLAENARFAEIVQAHGIAFIGPSVEHIRTMGDKVTARETARDLGLPIVPGSDGPVDDPAAARRLARDLGFPVLVKAAAGGGGIGMIRVADEDALEAALVQASTVARLQFGNAAVYIEKCLDHPRHIEFQIVGDGLGAAIHLGERDCSLQRRHQKLLEETPSPALSGADRRRMGTLSAEAMAKLGYRGVGTLEFLYQDGAFYFIEMNTRLQVEHPVTEMVTGLDLVREQIVIAAGGSLSLSQADVGANGHAIECRITAEDPVSFRPAPGRITRYHAPGGLGVRVDSALYAGYRIPAMYDSLAAKLVVHGRDRQECLMRLARALEEYVIEGVDTTLPLHLRILRDAEFAAGHYDVHWLERFVARATG